MTIHASSVTESMLLIVIADNFDDTLPKPAKFLAGRLNCEWSPLEALRLERHCCTWRTVSTTSSDTKMAAMADITAAVTTVDMLTPEATVAAPSAPTNPAATAGKGKQTQVSKNSPQPIKTPIMVDLLMC